MWPRSSWDKRRRFSAGASVAYAEVTEGWYTGARYSTLAVGYPVNTTPFTVAGVWSQSALLPIGAPGSVWLMDNLAFPAPPGAGWQMGLGHDTRGFGQVAFGSGVCNPFTLTAGVPSDVDVLHTCVMTVTTCPGGTMRFYNDGVLTYTSPSAITCADLAANQWLVGDSPWSPARAQFGVALSCMAVTAASQAVITAWHASMTAARAVLPLIVPGQPYQWFKMNQLGVALPGAGSLVPGYTLPATDPSGLLQVRSYPWAQGW